MLALRILGQALRDTWDNLVTYTLVSLLWWACLILIVPAPSATLVLYLHADPRNGITTDRPTFGETLRLILHRLGPAWLLALLTLPIAALLAYNLLFYGASGSGLGVIAPLWLVLFFFWFAITQVAVATLALNESMGPGGLGTADATRPWTPRSPAQALKVALILIGNRLPTAIVLVLGVWLIVGLSALLIVPLFSFTPALVANAFNRLTLQGLRLQVADPNAPTPERRAEGPPAGRRKWFGP